MKIFVGIVSVALGVFIQLLIKGWPDFFPHQLAPIVPGVSVLLIVLGVLCIGLACLSYVRHRGTPIR
jgi:hypothetical protein